MSSEILKNLLLEDKKLKEENKKLKEENKKLKEENQKLLIEKLQKRIENRKKENEKLRQVKTELETKSKPKSKSKPKQKPIPKQKIKTFDEYFQECIKNKTIPKDTPPYLKKALERTMKEYDKGIKHEKSALKFFSEKYVIDGKPGLTPIQYFTEKSPQIKEFLRNHRNIKVRMIMVCIMERIEPSGYTFFRNEMYGYFNSERYINLESTDVKNILAQMILEIKDHIYYFQQGDSGWYFKEVKSLEIHTVDYKPIKGSSYIPLPDFLMRKKAIINMENKNDKCFLWCVLRCLHPKQWHEERVAYLREYENDLNFKGI